MENTDRIIIRVAQQEDEPYAFQITEEMARSAQARGTGMAKRSPDYVMQKIHEGKAERAVAQAMGNVAATLGKLASEDCLFMTQNFGFIRFP